MNCPKCGTEIEITAADAASTIGTLGGKAGTGASKRRNVTPEMARKAANARWARVRGKKGGRPRIKTVEKGKGTK